MKYSFFRRALLLFPLLTLLLTLAACSKKEETAPSNGSISGQVTPATAVALVTASKAGGTAITAVPSAAGGFSFTGLAAGDYTLTFAVASGYVVPASTTVTLAQGQNLVVPTLLVLDTKTALLTGSRWRVSDFTVNRVSTSSTNQSEFIDVYARMDACERDNFFRFALPDVFTEDEGATKCSSSSPQTRSGTWSFDANKTHLRIPYAYSPQQGYEILQFDANTIRLRHIQFPTSTFTITEAITLTSF